MAERTIHTSRPAQPEPSSGAHGASPGRIKIIEQVNRAILRGSLPRVPGKEIAKAATGLIGEVG